MERNGLVASLTHNLQGVIDAEIRRVALRTRSKIYHSLSQRYASFGPTNLHHRIEGGVSKQKCIGVGESDILSRTNDEATGYELRVFPTLYHARHPVECAVRVASAYTLYERRYDVVVHLAFLIICKRVLLQARHNHLVVYHYLIAGTRLNDELQDVEQLAGVATAIAQQGVGLLQLDIKLREFNVGCNCAVEQLQQVFLLQRFQDIQLTAREQRAYHLERRVLCGGTYERDDAPLHSAEQRILLRLAETVNLVDEENRRSRIEEASALGTLYHVAHILNTTRHGTKRVERCLKTMRNNLCESCFAHSGRSPQYKGGHASALNHLAQDGILAH